jgi:hypothetical protein
MKTRRANILSSVGAILVAASSASFALGAEPTPAAIAFADTVLRDTGLKITLDAIVPLLLSQFQRSITASRPELQEPLQQTLTALEPEFLKTEESVMADAAHNFAGRMSEQDLKNTAAFFETDAGKKYLVAQSGFVTDFGAAIDAWRQKLDPLIVARVREELKKKGYEF